MNAFTHGTGLVEKPAMSVISNSIRNTNKSSYLLLFYTYQLQADIALQKREQNQVPTTIYTEIRDDYEA